MLVSLDLYGLYLMLSGKREDKCVAAGPVNDA